MFKYFSLIFLLISFANEKKIEIKNFPINYELLDYCKFKENQFYPLNPDIISTNKE